MRLNGFIVGTTQKHLAIYNNFINIDKNNHSSSNSNSNSNSKTKNVWCFLVQHDVFANSHCNMLHSVLIHYCWYLVFLSYLLLLLSTGISFQYDFSHLFHVSWTSRTMLCFSITLVIYYLIFCKTFSSRTYEHISLNTASFRSVGITKIARAICLIWVYILIRIEDSSWGKV